MILFIVLLLIVLIVMYFFLIQPTGLAVPLQGPVKGLFSKKIEFVPPVEHIVPGPPVNTVSPIQIQPHSVPQTRGLKDALPDPSQTQIFVPKKIIIIREGNGKNVLNDAGIKRATVIADWASPVKGPNPHEADLMALTGGIPVAAVYTHNPSPSMLSILTAEPASFQLQIPLFVIPNQSDAKDLVNQIYSNPAVKDKVVLVVWQHNCVQSVMSELNLVAPFWPDDNMGRVLVVDGDKTNYTIGCEKFDEIVDSMLPVNGRLDSVVCAEPLKFANQICTV